MTRDNRAATDAEKNEQQAYAEGLVSDKVCIRSQRGHLARIQVASFLQLLLRLLQTLQWTGTPTGLYAWDPEPLCELDPSEGDVIEATCDLCLGKPGGGIKNEGRVLEWPWHWPCGEGAATQWGRTESARAPAIRGYHTQECQCQIYGVLKQLSV